MILAAGLGTRLRPLTRLKPKPALPVGGRPVIAYLLALLARHGVREVVVNRSYLAEVLTEAIETHTPAGLQVHYSDEPEPLGTGGGLRRAADFLAGSDPSIVLAGDMLFDADLTALARRHLEAGRRATLVLREDPRAGAFGTIGLDAKGRLRRIATRFDLGDEQHAGVFTGVRLFSPGIFRDWPHRDAFEDLAEWLAPQVAGGARDIGGVLLSPGESVWEPVGTPAEYLRANLSPVALSYAADLPSDPAHPAARADLVVGRGARIAEPGLLRRCVVWAGESVGANLRAESGVFAGGEFIPCPDEPDEAAGAKEAIDG
jgi:NDP-sugar pyrophosphorylase family protein